MSVADSMDVFPRRARILAGRASGLAADCALLKAAIAHRWPDNRLNQLFTRIA
jgi:hypothetical protein